MTSTFDLRDQARTWTERVRRSILTAHAEGGDFDAKAYKVIRRTLRPGDDLLPGEPIPLTQADIDADPAPRPDWTIRRALQHYDDTATDTLRGWRQARARIRMWQGQALATTRLDALTPEDLAAWVAGRTKTCGGVVMQVAASTVRNDIYRISALYELAAAPRTKGGWNLPLKNPVSLVSLPSLPEGRQARLEHDEDGGDLARILAALATGPDADAMSALVTVAIETGMRRSEILDLRAGQVRRTPGGYVIERPFSKSGARRRVVLTDAAAAAIIPLRNGREPDERIIPLSPDSVAYRWDRARAIAECPNLRMHDLRHEAMSSMADAGLSVGALAAQGGYRTMQTLLRYVNASERDIREKLAKR